MLHENGRNSWSQNARPVSREIFADAAERRLMERNSYGTPKTGPGRTSSPSRSILRHSSPSRWLPRSASDPALDALTKEINVLTTERDKITNLMELIQPYSGLPDPSHRNQPERTMPPASRSNGPEAVAAHSSYAAMLRAGDFVPSRPWDHGEPTSAAAAAADPHPLQPPDPLPGPPPPFASPAAGLPRPLRPVTPHRTDPYGLLEGPGPAPPPDLSASRDGRTGPAWGGPGLSNQMLAGTGMPR